LLLKFGGLLQIWCIYFLPCVAFSPPTKSTEISSTKTKTCPLALSMGCEAWGNI